MRFSTLAIVYLLVVLPLLGLVLDIVTVVDPDKTQLVGLLLKDGPLAVLVFIGIGKLLKDKWPLSLISLLGIICYFILSLIWVEAQQDWVVIAAGIRNYALYPLFYLVAYLLGQLGIAERLRTFRLFYYSFLANLMLGGLQALEVIGSPYAKWKKLGGGDEGFTWIHGGFISYIDYAFYLSYSVILLSLCMNKERKWFYRVYWTLPLCVACSGILVVLSQSRTGLAAWFIAVLVLFATSTTLIKFVGLVVTGISMAALLLSGVMAEHRLQLTLDAVDPRFVITLPFAIEAFLSHPFFGNGLASFGAASVVSVEQEAIGAEYLDSTMLSVGVQFGVVGWLLYYGFVVTQFMWIDRRTKTLKLTKLRIANFAIAVLVVLYSALFNFSDGWPGALFLFGWLGYLRAALAKRFSAKYKLGKNREAELVPSALTSPIWQKK